MADDDFAKSGTLLWQHTNPKSTRMWEFLQSVNARYNLSLATYHDLHKWSVDRVAEFWTFTAEFTGIVGTDLICHFDESRMFPRPPFFPKATLNFARNLLYPAGIHIDPDTPAVIAVTEIQREQVTWRELRARVAKCQAAIRAAGVNKNDAVAGLMGNNTNALVAMLATTSLGAIWTAISPDTGATAVIDRWRQIAPVMLFCDNAALYNGKTYSAQSKILDIIGALKSLMNVVAFETTMDDKFRTLLESRAGSVPALRLYSTFISSDLPVLTPDEPDFVELPADHPVYILYSSGTTGEPKCIVHGALGTLLQHKKEHVIHCDIRPGDRLFYFTTCTWMMWHWLTSGLACGATLILYDGSPFRYRSSNKDESLHDHYAMPRLIDELRINHFGTSAKYLSMLEQNNIEPGTEGISLASLKNVYSTGSPLAPSTFAYVYRKWKPDLLLGSITGGTDIISLFGAPCPLTPVFSGEIQVAGLGMSVRAWDYKGNDVTNSGEAGDLVCTKPFLPQPVTFFGEDGQKKYKASYFSTFPDVWHHGDFVRFNPITGGLYMLGRSDGILKPSGVRFGSAEIYNLLLRHFPNEVEDALCIGRRRETDTDETVVLFLKMNDGQEFNEGLVAAIKKAIASNLSARHVPGMIDQTPEIPVTTNGKKVEGAVKQILCGMSIQTSASVANAACLDWYKRWSGDHP